MKIIAFSTQVALLVAEESQSLRGTPPLSAPPRQLATDGDGVTKNEIGHEFRHIQFVTCPFLGSLLNADSGVHGAPLLNQDFCRSKDKNGKWDGKCSRAELEKITLRAGMDPLRVAAHIEGNFANFPSQASISFGHHQEIDLYNMEGAMNEHATSTGLNDCETVYWGCYRENGIHKCNSQLIIPDKDGFDGASFSRDIKDCKLHASPDQREATFNDLWKKFMAAQKVMTYKGKLWITHWGLERADEKGKFPVNDFNGLGGGTISGAFGFLIDACISCDKGVVLKDPWTGSPYAIESLALYDWNRKRRLPSGFALDKGENHVRVQWHMSQSSKDRDDDGVSCDDVCASLGFDGNPQQCVDDWLKQGRGSLLAQVQKKSDMSIVGRQAAFTCTLHRHSVYGPVISEPGHTRTNPRVVCYATDPRAKKHINCKTRMPKNLAGRKICPCKPVDPTGYGRVKNSAGKRRHNVPLPETGLVTIR